MSIKVRVIGSVEVTSAAQRGTDISAVTTLCLGTETLMRGRAGSVIRQVGKLIHLILEKLFK